MGLTNFFKKGEAEDKQAVQSFIPDTSAAPVSSANTGEGAGETSSADEAKKARHGEPGVCCGSCS